MKSLAQEYDCLLLDLDGTAFRGHSATEGAVQALADVPGRTFFVTNNASRSADEVAAHLTDLGFTATADDVATSAQSAARMLADQVPPRSPVLIVGTDALGNEVAAVGLRPVRRYDDGPLAVVQGLSMTIGWADLAEAALAISAGALWVAANVDVTLPTERGLLPGNGAFVAALRAATGAEPQVAGKPAPGLLKDAAARGDFRAPLVVGDRLDTDIEGANAAELPSLMVLTGVSSVRDAVYAKPSQRPTYIGNDLRSLHQDGEQLAVGPQPDWRVDVANQAITVSGNGSDDGDGLSIVRAVASAVWGTAPSDSPAPVRIEAADDQARAALQRWSLVHSD
jgi:glycerol-1-phosphatase